jgi:3D (Asp-Asp-Asp) domain-containing protein
MVGLIFILLFGSQDTVTATTYKLTAAENGPYGNNMASGYKVSYKHPGSSRVIAVSPDLLTKFPYHTDVIIEGAGKLDGKYKVEDVMSSRWHNRIDILLNWKVKHNKFYNVKITSYGKHKHQSSTRNSIRRVNAIHHVRTKRNYKPLQKRNNRSKKNYRKNR